MSEEIKHTYPLLDDPRYQDYIPNAHDDDVLVDTDTFRKRRRECQNCEYKYRHWIGGEVPPRFSSFTNCQLCGCNLRYKACWKNERCPDGRW